MKLEWVLLAEGLGIDSKGAITAIGINQNVLATPVLPAATKRALICHLSGDEGEVKTGDRLTLRFNVTSPSGKVIAANTGQVTMGPALWPDLPVSLDLPTELVITFDEYGRHVFDVAVQFGGPPEITGHVDFYVIDAVGPQPPTVAANVLLRYQLAIS